MIPLSLKKQTLCSSDSVYLILHPIMNEGGDLGGLAPSSCHSDEVVFELLETLINPVGRRGFDHSAKPFRRVEFRTVGRSFARQKTSGEARHWAKLFPKKVRDTFGIL